MVLHKRNDQVQYFSRAQIPVVIFLNNNKKVLLRERKRHTARCIANTPSGQVPPLPPSPHPWPRYPPQPRCPPPPQLDLARYPPSPPAGPGQVPPPPPLWTDIQTETITFPHPSDAGGNKDLSYDEHGLNQVDLFASKSLKTTFKMFDYNEHLRATINFVYLYLSYCSDSSVCNLRDVQTLLKLAFKHITSHSS